MSAIAAWEEPRPARTAPGKRCKKLMGHTDLLAAVGVVLIVTMLVIPLPAALLDLFITLNIRTAGSRSSSRRSTSTARSTSPRSRRCCC